MARVELPIVALNSTTGLPVAGAAVQVKYRSSGTNATWWTQETGGTSSTAAITTDSAGRTSAWLDRGAYNCNVTGTGITPYTEPFDASPASDNAIDSLWLPDNVIANRHLADNAVNTAELAALAVTTPKLAAASVDDTKLAAAAKNLFPQWFSAANLQVKYGITDANNGLTWGGTNITSSTIAHGLGRTPVWATFQTDTGVSTGDGTDIIQGSFQNTPYDATNIYLKLATRSGGNQNFPGVNIYWLVIG